MWLTVCVLFVAVPYPPVSQFWMVPYIAPLHRCGSRLVFDGIYYWAKKHGCTEKAFVSDDRAIGEHDQTDQCTKLNSTNAT